MLVFLSVNLVNSKIYNPTITNIPAQTISPAITESISTQSNDTNSPKTTMIPIADAETETQEMPKADTKKSENLLKKAWNKTMEYKKTAIITTATIIASILIANEQIRAQKIKEEKRKHVSKFYGEAEAQYPNPKINPLSPAKEAEFQAAVEAEQFLK